jgi:hypothetical protein
MVEGETTDYNVEFSVGEGKRFGVGHSKAYVAESALHACLLSDRQGCFGQIDAHPTSWHRSASVIAT